MEVMGAAQVKSLLLIASQLSGYPIPADPPPPIQVVTPVEMARQADELGVIGFYHPPGDEDDPVERIVIDGDEANANHSRNAIAVHELTHWLQYHNWVNPDSNECPREFRREYEAYLTGFRYEFIYEHKNADRHVFMVPPVLCDFTVK